MSSIGGAADPQQPPNTSGRSARKGRGGRVQQQQTSDVIIRWPLPDAIGRAREILAAGPRSIVTQQYTAHPGVSRRKSSIPIDFIDIEGNR
jgi:hypothetical protein